MLESLNYYISPPEEKKNNQLLKENPNQKSTQWDSPSLTYVDPPTSNASDKTLLQSDNQ